jgi:hypothetical protein
VRAFCISAERSAGTAIVVMTTVTHRREATHPIDGEIAMAVSTKKTQLWFVYTDSNGTDIVQLGCPKGITGLGGSKSQIDTTCLDSDEMEFSPGMGSPGALTVNIDFDPAKVSHRDLVEMDEDDTITTWVIGLSDGTALPTVDSAGTVTYPDTRTFVSFEGYIADLPLDFAINQNVQSAASIQRTGAKTYHFKA